MGVGNIRISVITPCFNGGRYVEECSRAVAKSMTWGNFEIEHIVVDDGSTDDSGQVLDRLQRQGLRVVFLERNGGQAKARNVGLQTALGEYIWFLDVDDLLFTNSLSSLWSVMKDTGADWAYGDFVRGDGAGRYLIGEDYFGRDFETAVQVLESMYTGKHFFQQNSLYKASLLKKVGGFDDDLRMAEDFDLATRLLLTGCRPRYVAGPLYMHRYHDRNLSWTYRGDPEKHGRDVAHLFDRYQQELEQVLPQESFFRVRKWVKSREV